MLILTAAKLFVLAGITTTLGGAALGTAVLFAGYVIAASKNPEEADKLFNITLMGFALIETFVFLSFILAAVSFLLI